MNVSVFYQTLITFLFIPHPSSFILYSSPISFLIDGSIASAQIW